jgi:hypothetical protein
VRELRADGESGDVDVIIQGGLYTLDETLTFGLKDSAPAGAVTRYRAAEGEQPVISGGRVITGWKKSKLQGGNIWTAEVPWAKGDAFFHCLYDTGKPMQRAQSDASVSLTPDNPKAYYASPHKDRVHFKVSQGELKAWDNLEDIELFGSPGPGWMVNYMRIASLDLETGKGELAVPASYKVDGKFVVENCIDHLDAPGEWVVDSKQGLLYYWPASGTPGDEILVTPLNTLIRIEGATDSSFAGTGDRPVEGLVFEGLQFSHADRQKWLPEDVGIQHDWDMWDKNNGLIRFRGAKNCVVKNCTFTDSGSDGIRLDLFCQNITVKDSVFKDLGGVGVLLCGYGPGKKDVNKNNTIQNNEILRIGNLFKHSPGIFIWQSGHNTIAHNHIHDLAYSGIVVAGVRRRFFNQRFQEMGKGNPFAKWTFDPETRENMGTIRWEEISLGDDIESWATYEPYMHARNNIIEFNEIHDCLKLLHDGNCIYLSANGDGNIVRYNVTHNHPKGAMIRTDDDSHGNVVEGNLLFGTTCNIGLQIKGLNIATGNFLINCQLTTGRAGNSVDPDATLSHNVFYHTSTKFEGFHYGLMRVKDGLDYNLYYHEGGKGEAFLEAQKAESRTNLIDKNSVVSDPMFIDHIHGDFGFKEGSPGFDLGIKPLTLELVQKMGTLNDPFLKRFSDGVPMHFEHQVKNKSKNKSKKAKKNTK